LFCRKLLLRLIFNLFVDLQTQFIIIIIRLSFGLLTEYPDTGTRGGQGGGGWEGSSG
jgi:hypothetical protein